MTSSFPLCFTACDHVAQDQSGHEKRQFSDRASLEAHNKGRELWQALTLSVMQSVAREGSRGEHALGLSSSQLQAKGALASTHSFCHAVICKGREQGRACTRSVINSVTSEGSISKHSLFTVMQSVARVGSRGGSRRNHSISLSCSQLQGQGALGSTHSFC